MIVCVQGVSFIFWILWNTELRKFQRQDAPSNKLNSQAFNANDSVLPIVFVSLMFSSISFLLQVNIM